MVVDSKTTCDFGAQDAEVTESDAFLVVLTGASSQSVALPRDRVISVGRSRSCEVVLDDQGASRLHFTLAWGGGADVLLVDRASRNGTTVEGHLIHGELSVPTGTEIRVGATRMIVVVRVGAEPSVTEPRTEEVSDLIARSPAMLAAVARVDRAATSDATVYVRGETGVGKELVARRIHARSRRAAAPYVVLNCATIPETLAESILFGHERGSFTGAVRQQKGVFEAAHTGTLFLDEIGELSLTNQARLLRVLEDHTVTRLGSSRAFAVDVRVVVATHRDLAARVREGSFREDLLFRLDVIRIDVPALRDRPEDVLPIAERWLRELAPGRAVKLSSSARRALLAYEWPGNVRELRNRIEAAVATRTSDVLEEADFSSISGPSRAATSPLRDRVEDAERITIVEALRACEGNQTRVAERLGISRRTLVYRLERYGLQDIALEERRKRAREPRH